MTFHLVMVEFHDAPKQPLIIRQQIANQIHPVMRVQLSFSGVFCDIFGHKKLRSSVRNMGILIAAVAIALPVSAQFDAARRKATLSELCNSSHSPRDTRLIM